MGEPDAAGERPSVAPGAPPAADDGELDVGVFRREVARDRARAGATLAFIVAVPLIVLGLYGLYVFATLGSSLWDVVFKGRLE